MDSADLLFVQQYFREEEKREPTETEIKILDTYWSDHCRHTTFETILDSVNIPKSINTKAIQDSYNDYLSIRKNIYKENIDKKPITLMDMATISSKKIRFEGNADDIEISDEINACSIFIDVDIVNYKSNDANCYTEKYLLMFKNETHNHPTEIEPFGGASTCIGGAIRDPLSGRAFVYQGIRVTGSANPLEKIDETIVGKLPQRKITTGAAKGFSSYGNQIGLATSHITEIYHQGYKAKRMEVGAVVAATPAKNVIRIKPVAGDKIILLGGKTGRDGCGGATGSSKEHTNESINLCSSEVQKGNAPEERKIQRLFRNESLTKLIKKCNDFGAGGVCVAVGELADGLIINLDNIPVKYIGLNATELAISESQERMAVVIADNDSLKFLSLCNEENIEAVEIAIVTEEKRLILKYKNKEVANLSRAFLDSNGIRKHSTIDVEEPTKNNPFTTPNIPKNLEENIKKQLTNLNISSQKGLVEMFDASIGATTVLMPFGGKYQLTPTDVSIHKIPIIDGESDTASAISWGFNPEIFSWSPFHGGAYAVIESMAKIVSAGGEYKSIRLSFQEYFEKLGKDPKKWAKPFTALLGTQSVMHSFDIPAIGGKDSMSGSFAKISVPPTLISFAVTKVSAKNIISPEFKEEGYNIYILKHKQNSDFTPNLEQLKLNFDFLIKAIKEKKIISSQVIKSGGIIEAVLKMSFGNMIGADIKYDLKELFKMDYGSFIIVSEGKIENENLIYLGQTIAEKSIIINTEKISLSSLLDSWESTLESVFPTKSNNKLVTYNTPLYPATKLLKPREIVKKPVVFIPIFPGTNCEYDLHNSFVKEGAIVNSFVFRNLNKSDIDKSILEMSEYIDKCNILTIAGGFSAGDEPDGSAKFIATVLRNEKIKKSVQKLLKRDGLILGICNGFQALVKSGLLPNAEIGNVNENSPTLTHNDIGRHISTMVTTKIISNKSPWLSSFKLGKRHSIATSHSEGRFVINENQFIELSRNGQIATQYVDFHNIATNDTNFNPNGSDYAIEGITSLDGRIFGKMGHSERIGKNIYKNIIGDNEQNILKNGINYFKGEV